MIDRRIVAFTVLALIAAACDTAPGGDSSPAPTSSTTTVPATTMPTGVPSTSVPTTTTPTSPHAAPAGLVFHNGTLITIDPARPRATAIAIANGEIVGVGDDDEILLQVGPETEVIDLQGRTMLPGLADAHSHFFAEGQTRDSGAGIQQSEILRRGITSVGEAGVTPDLLEVLEGYESRGELAVHLSAYLLYNDSCGAPTGDWWKSQSPRRDPSSRLWVNGVKLFNDGGSCNVPAVSYTYESGARGEPYMTVAEVGAVLTEIQDLGFQAAVHALGDRAIAIVLDAIGEIAADGNPLRHRIEHNAVVGPDLYGKHDDSGAVGVIFGGFTTCFFTGAEGTYRYRTPPEYSSWEWPWRSLLDSNPNTPFAWHADWPPFQFDFGGQLAGFVTRIEPRDDGECQPTDAMKAGTITVEEALELMTMGGAYALHRDHLIGSLTVGKRADLIIVDHDPTAIPTQDLWSVQLVATIIEGSTVYCIETEACPTGGNVIPEPSEPEPECYPESPNLALSRPAVASNSLPGLSAALAVDGDPDTHWGSGQFPTQWIEIDLGEAMAVSCLRLRASQSPAGSTTHRINGGAHPDPGAELGVLVGVTGEGQWLQLEGDWTIRYLRITTEASPSWVSWFEIVVR